MNGISGVNSSSGYDRMNGMSDMSGMDGVNRRPPPPPPPSSEEQSVGGVEGQSGAQGFDFASQETGESSGFDFESAPPPPPPPPQNTDATTSTDDQMTDMMTALQSMLDNIFTLFSTEDDTSTS